MTDFHAIVIGSRLTTACQHWQSMCQIIYYYPFFQQHSFLNWADIFSSFLGEVENVLFAITTLQYVGWRHPVYVACR